MALTEAEMAEAAMKALEAGKRRQLLAQSMARASQSSSDDVVKRPRGEVQPTPSTKVTPEPKKVHKEAEVCPRRLSFSEGGEERLDESVKTKSSGDGQAEKVFMQQLASPQQAAPLTSVSQPGVPIISDSLDLRAAESTSMHDAEEVQATLPQPESDPDQSPSDAKPVVEIFDETPTQVYPDNQLGLSEYAESPSLEASPAPVIRQAEAAAAATPMKSDVDVPRALVDEMKQLHISTPKPKPAPQNKTPDEAIKFTGLTPDAVKVWTALLRRQSTDSIPESPAPSMAPPGLEPVGASTAAAGVETPGASKAAGAEPAAPAAPKQPPQTEETHPRSTEAAAKAKPAEPNLVAPGAFPVSELSPFQLMKMDDAQLVHQLDRVRQCPEFLEFEKGVHVPPSDPLKTLLLFDVWMQQHAKTAPQEQQQQPANTEAAPPPTAPAPSTGPTGPADHECDCGDGDQGDAEEKKAARACYMRYYRSVRSAKVPAAVAVKFREACSDPTGKLAAELFTAYIECNENWLSSSIVLEESQIHNESEGGRWGWLTKEDLLVKYHGNRALVQELVASKVQSQLFQEHPEFPGNEEMYLYKCWQEFYESSENLHRRSTTRTREGEDEHTQNSENLDSGNGATGSGGKGQHGNKGKGNGKKKPNAPAVPKPKKEKTQDQLARNALTKANANLLEISQWRFRLVKAGTAEVVADAFTAQMESEGEKLRKAKEEIERVLASGGDLGPATNVLDAANEGYKTASIPIRKHTTIPKAKGAAKAKGAGKAS